MPLRLWTHYCSIAQEEISGYTKKCPMCDSRAARFEGWRLHPVEAEQQFERFFRLRARGRHKKFLRELFKEAVMECPTCQGNGIVGVDDFYRHWQWCTMCDGMGRLKLVDEATFEQLRQKVLEKYPRAALKEEKPDRRKKRARKPEKEELEEFLKNHSPEFIHFLRFSGILVDGVDEDIDDPPPDHPDIDPFAPLPEGE